jgi:hypothetical protein
VSSKVVVVAASTMANSAVLYLTMEANSCKSYGDWQLPPADAILAKARLKRRVGRRRSGEETTAESAVENLTKTPLQAYGRQNLASTEGGHGLARGCRGAAELQRCGQTSTM